MTFPDTDTLATLGGVMQNYAPVEDASTDLDAAFDNKARANVAALTAVSARCYAQFTGHATTPVLTEHVAGWPEVVLPTVTKQGTGHYRLTWPATVLDALGASHALNFRGGWSNVQGTTAYHVNVSRQAANVLDVRTFNASGTANDAAGVTFDIWGF